MSSELKTESVRSEPPIVVTEPRPTTGRRPDDELTLADYIAIVWRRRKLVLACAVTGLIVAAVAHFVLPAKYEATALILPPQGDEGSSGMAAKLAGLSDSLPVGLLGVKSPEERYVDILTSQRVADAMAEKFSLMERYGTESRVKVRENLAKRSGFDSTKGGMISITVTDRDPETAAKMANTYGDILGEIDGELNVGKAGRERRFLDERLVAVEKDLKAAQEAWKAFQEKHRIVAVDEGLKATATVMAELEARRMAKEIEVQVLETAYSKTSPQVEMARTELRKLEEKLRDVSQHGVRPASSSPSNPPPSTLHPQPDGEASQWLFPAVEKVPELAMEQMDLERRLRLHGELYKLLVTQREMTRISEAKERSTVQVVAAATAPDRRAGMGGGARIFVGIGIGLAFGVTVAVLLARPGLAVSGRSGN